MAKGDAAPGKRIKISKMQQQTFLIVLITSLALGMCIVLGIYLVKYIVFNGKVISAKDTAISNYETTIKNVGICRDSDKDGKFSDKELSNCVPENIAVETVPGTLRYNVMVDMANNADLESVARDTLTQCYDTDGKKYDYVEKYDEATTDEQRTYWLYLMRMCSALRVIPDALPAQENQEALMASLNQIFILSAWEPESLSPSSSIVQSQISGLGTIPLNLSIEADSATTMQVLSNIEKSIRSFDVSTATIGWTNSGIELRAQVTSYYSDEIDAQEKTQTVFATNRAKKKAGGS